MNTVNHVKASANRYCTLDGFMIFTLRALALCHVLHSLEL